MNVEYTGNGRHTAKLRHKIDKISGLERKSRKEQIVLARMRIGHIRVISYLHRFNTRDDNNCEQCGSEEDLEHILIKCTKV